MYIGLEMLFGSAIVCFLVGVRARAGGRREQKRAGMNDSFVPMWRHPIA
jgi:hypothetical protein